MARPRNISAAARTAEQYFTIYYALGVDRSLAKLREASPRYGLPRVALSTLAKYSGIGNWQERVHQLDEQTARSATADAVRAVQDMNAQQAAIGAMGVQLAGYALERMLRQLRQAEACDKCGMEPLELDAGDVTRVMDTFAKWQRLGMGEVTDRREIAVTIWNVIIQEIVQLFLAVNIYDEPDQRKREYALGVDEIVQRHVAVLTE